MKRNAQRIDFDAMGTQFFCIVVEPSEEIFDSIFLLAQDLENKWSRFKPDSELMKLNNNPDVAVTVSPETIRLLNEMKIGYEITDGKFDPNVLGDVLDSGFAVSKRNNSERTEWSARSQSKSTFEDVIVDESNSTVLLPSGVGIDAGGIGKGLAADLIATRALELGAMGVAAFAGGEVAVKGIPPEGEGWEISISDPRDSSIFIDKIRLSLGGVATSNVTGWVSDQGKSHIMTPGLEKHGAAEVIQATVITNAAVHAEVMTKMCFGTPVTEALALVEAAGGQALIVDKDFQLHETTEWKKYK